MISKTYAIAVKNGSKYIWINTYYIDKTNHTELSKAINSIYR